MCECLCVCIQQPLGEGCLISGGGKRGHSIRTEFALPPKGADNVLSPSQRGVAPPSPTLAPLIFSFLHFPLLFSLVLCLPAFILSLAFSFCLVGWINPGQGRRSLQGLGERPTGEGLGAVVLRGPRVVFSAHSRMPISNTRRAENAAACTEAHEAGQLSLHGHCPLQRTLQDTAEMCDRVSDALFHPARAGPPTTAGVFWCGGIAYDHSHPPSAIFGAHLTAGDCHFVNVSYCSLWLLTGMIPRARDRSPPVLPAPTLYHCPIVMLHLPRSIKLNTSNVIINPSTPRPLKVLKDIDITCHQIPPLLARLLHPLNRRTSFLGRIIRTTQEI